MRKKKHSLRSFQILFCLSFISEHITKELVCSFWTEQCNRRTFGWPVIWAFMVIGQRCSGGRYGDVSAPRPFCGAGTGTGPNYLRWTTFAAVADTKADLDSTQNEGESQINETKGLVVEILGRRTQFISGQR